MNKTIKILIVVILIAAVGIVIAIKQKEQNVVLLPTAETNQPQKTVSDSNDPLAVTVKTAESKKLPRLVDLGADKCIPCKMMKPVIDELDKEYKGKLQVEFYDVWKKPAYAKQYGIRVIPTQIFLDSDGKELFRHEGYFSKEDILAKWKNFGFEFNKKD
jgi:thioredoxin 1